MKRFLPFWAWSCWPCRCRHCRRHRPRFTILRYWCSKTVSRGWRVARRGRNSARSWAISSRRPPRRAHRRPTRRCHRRPARLSAAASIAFWCTNAGSKTPMPSRPPRHCACKAPTTNSMARCGFTSTVPCTWS